MEQQSPASFRRVLDVNLTGAWLGMRAAAQPTPRFGEPWDVARMVRFIVTDATFSTGSEFVMGGGILAGPADCPAPGE